MVIVVMDFGENMPGSNRLIDIIAEMNKQKSDGFWPETRDRIINKLHKLAELIFEIDRKSSDLIYVNHLLEEFIESTDGVKNSRRNSSLTKPELEKCNKIYKQYKELSK